MDRWWYPPLLGFLAAVDFFVIIIPTDGLIISSTLITPKKWFSLAVLTAVGSTLGAIAFAGFVQVEGLPWVLKYYPHLQEMEMWVWTQGFFAKYGLYLLFLIAASPIIQHPIVILTALTDTPLSKIFLIILSGRLLKFLVMTYISSHAPRLINKMWGVTDEVKEVGEILK